jgi:hypothetical protein
MRVEKVGVPPTYPIAEMRETPSVLNLKIPEFSVNGVVRAEMDAVWFTTLTPT